MAEFQQLIRGELVVCVTNGLSLEGVSPAQRRTCVSVIGGPLAVLWGRRIEICREMSISLSARYSFTIAVGLQRAASLTKP